MRFFVFLVVVLVAIAGFGFYRGWFTLTTSHDRPDDGKFSVKVDVNTDKIKSDTANAQQKARDLGESVTSAKTVKGTLVKVAAESFTMMDDKNNEMTFYVEPSSKIRLKDAETKLMSLQAGDQVTVVYLDKDGKNVVRAVTAERGS